MASAVALRNFFVLSLSVHIFISFHTQLSHAKESATTLCPGLYCGRMQLANGSYSQCAACKRGYKPNTQSVCVKCDTKADLYDWLYLGFMALLPLVLHSFFIDNTKKKKRAHITLHIAAIGECSLAAAATLLLFEPRGSLDLYTCSVQRLSDWYSMLYNPKPDFVNTIHCTQEIIYPLYTIVLVYYAFCLLLIFFVRIFVSRQFTAGTGTRSIYSALYFIPILIALQAACGGLLYYSFAYIMLIVAAITNVIYLAYYDNQTIRGILMEIIESPRNIVILLSHWFLYMYGIVAITRTTSLLPLIALFPLPTLFYILTVHFSDPDRLHLIGRSQ